MVRGLFIISQVELELVKDSRESIKARMQGKQKYQKSRRSP